MDGWTQLLYQYRAAHCLARADVLKILNYSTIRALVYDFHIWQAL